MKTYEGVNIYIHIFWTSAVAGGEWSALPPGERTPDTHWIGGWVGPTAGLDDVEKWKKIFYPTGTLDSSVVQPLASR
jgi:hypothetical protein